MTKPHRGPKIVTLDIEVAPMEAYVYGTFKVNIGLTQIKQDWTILSCAHKWLHSSTVHYNDVSKEKDKRNDRALLDKVWEVLDECDILVGQNGRQFDVKKIMARFVQAGMPPPSPFKIVDTLEMAKQIAKFTSNKQAWLSEILTDAPKEEHSEFPGYELWIECLKGNRRAWTVNKGYNKQDVVGCEKMYLRMLPYYEGHPNVAAYYDDDAMRCPRCGTPNMQELDKPALTNVGQYRRYQCAGCGGFARDRYTLNSKAKRHSLLSA